MSTEKIRSPFGRYTGAGTVTAPAIDCNDMNLAGSATDWLIAVKPDTAVCWQGWQLHTLGGWNSRFGSGGATENADFLSLSFSKSVGLDSRDFFPISESTLKADEFCMLPGWMFVLLSSKDEFALEWRYCQLGLYGQEIEKELLSIWCDHFRAIIYRNWR